MQEKLITFETAKLAKDKGFDWKNIEILEVKSKFAFLDSTTQSLLQRWLREVHKIHITVFIMERWLEDGHSMEVYFDITIKKQTKLGGLQDIPSKPRKFKTHEEALEKGLQEALKLI